MECRPLRRASLPTLLASSLPGTMPVALLHHSSASLFPSTCPCDPKTFNASFHPSCQPLRRSSKDRRSADAGPTRTRGSIRCRERRGHDLLRNPATGPDDRAGQLLHCRRTNPAPAVAENLLASASCTWMGTAPRNTHRRGLEELLDPRHQPTPGLCELLAGTAVAVGRVAHGLQHRRTGTDLTLLHQVQGTRTVPGVARQHVNSGDQLSVGVYHHRSFILVKALLLALWP